MHFIERWFGTAPDGGSGTLEMLVLTLSLVLAFLFATRRDIQAKIQRVRRIFAQGRSQQALSDKSAPLVAHLH
jgi:hypothetical protein